MKKEREEGEGERVQYLPLKQLTEVNLQDFKTALELYSSVKAIYHTRVLYVFSLNLWFVFLFFLIQLKYPDDAHAGCAACLYRMARDQEALEGTPSPPFPPPPPSNSLPSPFRPLSLSPSSQSSMFSF
jgi:hypothetical protein